VPIQSSARIPFGLGVVSLVTVAGVIAMQLLFGIAACGARRGPPPVKAPPLYEYCFNDEAGAMIEATVVGGGRRKGRRLPPLSAEDGQKPQPRFSCRARLDLRSLGERPPIRGRTERAARVRVCLRLLGPREPEAEVLRSAHSRFGSYAYPGARGQTRATRVVA
jgi:hypothetical protein